MKRHSTFVHLVAITTTAPPQQTTASVSRQPKGRIEATKKGSVIAIERYRFWCIYFKRAIRIYCIDAGLASLTDAVAATIDFRLHAARIRNFNFLSLSFVIVT